MGVESTIRVVLTMEIDGKLTGFAESFYQRVNLTVDVIIIAIIKCDRVLI